MVGIEPATPIIFYASQSGKSTLDQGEDGGNPFASSLIELLKRQSLTCADLCSDLITLTSNKSGGCQIPEYLSSTKPTQWILKPIHEHSIRVAFIIVYSDYQNVSVSPLPGAKRDLERVSAAFEAAAFNVKTMIDPERNPLEIALRMFLKKSEEAEIAAIYVTGHGFEDEGRVYLMPNNYPFNNRAKLLPELALYVPGLVDYLRARYANLLFFGGCRNYFKADRPAAQQSA